ncbi:G-protein coupled receptors family 1 profile domain-containing protein [Entamoeba marina]
MDIFIVFEYLICQLLGLSDDKIRMFVTHFIVWMTSLLTTIPIYRSDCGMQFATCGTTSNFTRWSVDIIPRCVISVLIILTALLTYIHKASLYTTIRQFIKFWKLEDPDTKITSKQSLKFLMFFCVISLLYLQPTIVLIMEKSFPEILTSLKVINASASEATWTLLLVVYFHRTFDLVRQWKVLLWRKGFIASDSETAESLHLL